MKRLLNSVHQNLEDLAPPPPARTWNWNVNGLLNVHSC